MKFLIGTCGPLLMLFLLAGQAAQAGLIAITDSRADLAGNDFIDLSPLAQMGSPLEPYFNPLTGRLLPTSTEIQFSLTSAGGIEADFLITIFSDVSEGTLDPNRTLLQVVAPSSGFLDGEPFTGLSMSTRGPAPQLNVFVTFGAGVYGVGTNVNLAGLQGRVVLAQDGDGATITGARVTGTTASPLSINRFVGFVTDAPEIEALQLRAFGQSSGDGNPFLQFNRIDLLTVAPQSAPPFGPGGGSPVPEPSSLSLAGMAIAMHLARRRIARRAMRPATSTRRTPQPARGET